MSGCRDAKVRWIPGRVRGRDVMVYLADDSILADGFQNGDR